MSKYVQCNAITSKWAIAFSVVLAVLSGCRSTHDSGLKEEARQGTETRCRTGTKSGQDDAFASVWGKAAIASVDSRNTPTATSVNGDIATLLFDDLSLDSQGTDLLRRSWAVSINIPLAIDPEAFIVGISEDLRGDISKSAGARATLVVIFARKVYVREYQFGDADLNKSDDQPPGELHQSFYVAEFSEISRYGRSQQPEGFFEIPNYTATILVEIERQSKQDFVRVSLDSLDLAVVRGAVGGGDPIKELNETIGNLRREYADLSRRGDAQPQHVRRTRQLSETIDLLQKALDKLKE